jgi:hypothetical protein
MHLCLNPFLTSNICTPTKTFFRQAWSPQYKLFTTVECKIKFYLQQNLVVEDIKPFFVHRHTIKIMFMRVRVHSTMGFLQDKFVKGYSHKILHFDGGEFFN